MKKYPQKYARGFTLLEVLVVVIILGVLAALIVPNLVGQVDKARIQAARQDIATLVNALKLYRLENKQYPSTEQGLNALIKKPTIGMIPENWSHPYLDKMPKDPWGKEYFYRYPGQKSEMDVYSLGADGKEGGELDNADIGNWQ